MMHFINKLQCFVVALFFGSCIITPKAEGSFDPLDVFIEGTKIRCESYIITEQNANNLQTDGFWDKINNGWQFIDNGRYFFQALNLFDDAVKLRPNDATAYYSRGTAYIWQEFYTFPQTDKAERYVLYQKAIADLTKAISIEPQHYKAYNNRGYVYYMLDKYDAAIKDYTLAINIKKDDYKPFFNRGEIYDHLQKLHEAIADYSKAIDNNDQISSLYRKRASVYFRLKDYQHTIADYTQAIKRSKDKSDEAGAYYDRGLTFMSLKDYKNAILDFSQVIIIDPQMTGAYSWRGECYKAIGDMVRATSDFENAEKFHP